MESTEHTESSASSATDEHSTLSDTSWSETSYSKDGTIQKPSLDKLLEELFEENILAKPLRTAVKSLPYVDPSSGHSAGFPEIVPQQGNGQGQWEFREPEFWTCGFFPGTLYALLERCTKYPGSLQFNTTQPNANAMRFRTQLLPLCRSWSEPLHAMARRTDTHDIGFIIMPALRRDWELLGNERSLASIIQAAHSLATRYVPSAGAIRSWDCLIKKDITVMDMEDNLLLIIDSMCNLDLLFYAAAQTGDRSLAEIATTHATTLLTTHLRSEDVQSLSKDGYRGRLYSTCHVANIDPKSGSFKWRWTAQGYANDSTWSRGQAWAILGYAQTYNWTKDEKFLEAACGTAEYFLYRLETSPDCVEILSDGISRKGRHVPLWDFDAPIQDRSQPLRDSSAGVIAANGMLLLSQALTALNRRRLSRHFFKAAVAIVRDTLDISLSNEKTIFRSPTDGSSCLEVADVVDGRTFEAILKHGTANNNENARRQYSKHGLVYGDYYLVEFGNLLLSIGLV